MFLLHISFCLAPLLVVRQLNPCITLPLHLHSFLQNKKSFIVPIKLFEFEFSSVSGGSNREGGGSSNMVEGKDGIRPG